MSGQITQNQKNQLKLENLVNEQELLIALGALGRRFESCAPTQSKPSHTSELPRLAFLMVTLMSNEIRLDYVMPCITLPNGIVQNAYYIHKIITIIPMIKKN